MELSIKVQSRLLLLQTPSLHRSLIILLNKIAHTALNRRVDSSWARTIAFITDLGFWSCSPSTQPRIDSGAFTFPKACPGDMLLSTSDRQDILGLR